MTTIRLAGATGAPAASRVRLSGAVGAGVQAPTIRLSGATGGSEPVTIPDTGAWLWVDGAPRPFELWIDVPDGPDSVLAIVNETV